MQRAEGLPASTSRSRFFSSSCRGFSKRRSTFREIRSTSVFLIFSGFNVIPFFGCSQNSRADFTSSCVIVSEFSASHGCSMHRNSRISVDDDATGAEPPHPEKIQGCFREMNSLQERVHVHFSQPEIRLLFSGKPSPRYPS